MKQQNLPNMEYNAIGINATAKKDKRQRIQFRFWLDRNKPHEAEWGKALDEMRGNPKTSFAAFMRNAVRLMLSLMTGDISVLMELYPGVVELIRESAPGKPSVASDDFELMMKEIVSVKEAVQASQSPKNGANSGIMSVNQIGGIKPLNAPNFDDDDDLLVVTKDEGAGNRASQNFISSMMALQGK